MSEITEQEFKKYVSVQMSGVTNMWDVKTVEELTNIPREKILTIMKEYGELMKKYPSAKKLAHIL